MPFFKFRRGDASSASCAGSAAQVESVEVLRRRARHRLIGASVLVVLGVIGFPLLFDTQPRPIPADLPIEIPGKNTARALPAPARPAPSAAQQEARRQAGEAPKPEVRPAIKLDVSPLREPAAEEAKSRSVVQVGAFADPAKAHDIRLKLEKAGFKTYTQIAETKDGQRIRVRVGPFASKEEAEKVSGKIRALDLPTAILTF